MFSSLIASITAALLIAGVAQGAATPEPELALWTLHTYVDPECLVGSQPVTHGYGRAGCTNVTPFKSAQFKADQGFVQGLTTLRIYREADCKGIPVSINLGITGICTPIPTIPIGGLGQSYEVVAGL